MNNGNDVFQHPEARSGESNSTGQDRCELTKTNSVSFALKWFFLPGKMENVQKTLRPVSSLSMLTKV